MKKWAQGLKQWSMWLVGEGSMPDRRAGLMLGATIAVVALLGVGAAFALQNPAPKKHGGVHAAEAAAAYRAKLRHGHGGKHTAATKRTHKATTATKSTTTTKKKHKTSRAAEYRKAVALATADQSKSGAKKTKAKHAKHKAKRHVRKTKRTGSASAAAAAGSAGSSAVPTLAAPIIPSSSPIPSGTAPPGAPTLVGATSGRRGSRVTWAAPTNDGTSPVTGYDLFVGTLPGAQYVTPVNGSRPVQGRSYTVSHLILGTTYYFTVKAINSVGSSMPSNQMAVTPPVTFPSVGSLPAPVVAMASNPEGTGYWSANSQGQITTHGAVTNEGSTAGLHLNAPIVEIVAAPHGPGYWEVASDGGVFTFGAAQFHGSMGGHALNAPIVGLVATADGKGYWEVASDGGVFTFGDARFGGSMGGQPLAQPMVGMALDPVTGGYWEVARDGSVFAFGGAPRLGSPSSLGCGRLRRRHRLGAQRSGVLGGDRQRRRLLLRLGHLPRARSRRSRSMPRSVVCASTGRPVGTGCSRWTVEPSPSEPRSSGRPDFPEQARNPSGPEHPLEGGGSPCGAPGPLLGPVRAAGQAEPGVDPQIAKRFGLPALRPVADPGQGGQFGLPSEDEIAQGPAGQIGGGHTVADVPAGPGQARWRHRAPPRGTSPGRSRGARPSGG